MATTSITELKLKNEAEAAVFNNPLLLDNILTYVVYNSHKELLRGSDVAAIRLVDKNWLQSTSRILKKYSLVSMEIILGKTGNTNEVHGHPSEKSSAELLHNFVSTFGSQSRFADSLLTLHLDLHEKFFCTKNMQILKKILERCGESLLKLSIHFPIYGNFKLPKFETFDFPIMSKVGFYLNNWPEQNHVISEEAVETSENGVEFLQLVLTGTKNLKTFEYAFMDDSGLDIKILDSIKLPISLTEISSVLAEFTWDYTLLMRNQLPNLKELRFGILDNPSDEDMFRLLDRFKTSLECLEINNTVEPFGDEITFIRFPIMPKLKSLMIAGGKYQKHENSKEPLSKYLPELRNFDLRLETELVLVKWIENSRFESVSELCVNLFDEEVFKSLSLQFMELLKNSFPNVSKLEFNLYFMDIDLLQVLFREWSQLKFLHLIFHGNVSFKSTPNLLSSIFLGVPMKIIKQLGKISERSPEEDFLNIQKDINMPNSILNMTELTSLTLESKNTGKLPDGVFTNFLAFLQIALSKLPNLRKTEFRPAFQNEVHNH